MIEIIPDNIIQFNIHELSIVRVDTLKPDGEEFSYYFPLTRYSYIREGKDCVVDFITETIRANIYCVPTTYESTEQILPYIIKSLDKMIKKGVVVTTEPVFKTAGIIYTPGNEKGRIYAGHEITSLFRKAESGIRTFADLWVNNYVEYVASFEDHEGDYIELEWMKNYDDLMEMLFEETDAENGSILLDIIPIMGGGPPSAPDNPITHERIPVNSYFVLSLFNSERGRKTYFASLQNHHGGAGIYINYSSTIKGAYHFIDEESALKFALKYSGSLKDGVFEIEEVKESGLLRKNDWMMSYIEP